MENFIVSARKYRPITFKSVVGQENKLRNARGHQYDGGARVVGHREGVGQEANIAHNDGLAG
jgi:hypothetical protein